MRSPLRAAECRNCGRARDAADLDQMGWCSACRQRVVRRATVWARGIALLLTLTLALWIAYEVQPSTRFLVVWMALVAAAYVLVSNIVRRVAFEIIRARGVPPDEAADG